MRPMSDENALAGDKSDEMSFTEWQNLMKIGRKEAAALFGCTQRTIARIKCGKRLISPVERAGMYAILSSREKVMVK